MMAVMLVVVGIYIYIFIKILILVCQIICEEFVDQHFELLLRVVGILVLEM
jgi:hypothetical protein